MSVIFLAWVSDPPADEIVTTIDSGLIQVDFLRPLTIESELNVI